jgi:hypothetical protein
MVGSQDAFQRLDPKVKSQGMFQGLDHKVFCREEQDLFEILDLYFFGVKILVSILIELFPAAL